MRKVGFWISAVLLLLLGLSGVQGLFGDWGDAETLGQRVCTAGQGVFGVLGLVAGTGAVLKRRWAGNAALAFAVSVGFTAAFASVAWGGSGIGAGAASGALGLLLGLVLYLGVRGPRAEPSEEVPTEPPPVSPIPPAAP
jgi:hypothetical protein